MKPLPDKHGRLTRSLSNSFSEDIIRLFPVWRIHETLYAPFRTIDEIQRQ